VSAHAVAIALLSLGVAYLLWRIVKADWADWGDQ